MSRDPKLMEDIDVHVKSVSGEVVVELKMRSEATVLDVRKAVKVAPAPCQRFLLGSCELALEDRLAEVCADRPVELLLCVLSWPEIHVKALEVIGVEVGGVTAELDETPTSLLCRITQQSGNPFLDAEALWWGEDVVQGDEPLWKSILGIKSGKVSSSGPMPMKAVPDKAAGRVLLNVGINPAKIEEDSLLHGLPYGHVYTSHPMGQKGLETWGWGRLASEEKDDVLAIRLMTASMCGNTRPEGPYLVEYLGTVEKLPLPKGCYQPGPSGKTVLDTMTKTVIAFSCKHLHEERTTADGTIRCELRCRRGRLRIKKHAPEEAATTRVVGDFSLVLADSTHGEIVAYCPCEAQTGFQTPPEELTSLLFTTALIRVPSCAHVSQVPRRYAPSRFEDFIMNRLFYGR